MRPPLVDKRPRIRQAPRLGKQKVIVERENHIGILEVINRIQLLPIGELRPRVDRYAARSVHNCAISLREMF